MGGLTDPIPTSPGQLARTVPETKGELSAVTEAFHELETSVNELLARLSDYTRDDVPETSNVAKLNEPQIEANSPCGRELRGLCNDVKQFNSWVRSSLHRLEL